MCDAQDAYTSNSFDAVSIVCEYLGLKYDDTQEMCNSCYNADSLNQASAVLAGKKTGRETKKMLVASQYIVDRHKWSVLFGTTPVMKRLVGCIIIVCVI